MPKQPWHLGVRDYVAVAKEAADGLKRDRGTLLAAGSAYYGMLSLFPALGAIVLIYGLVADPDTVTNHIDSVFSVLPESAADLVATQLRDLTDGDSTSFGWGLVLTVFGALFTASAALNGVVVAIGVAYETTESRNAIFLRALAVLLTLGAALLIVVAVGALTVAGPLLRAAGLASLASTVEVLRWPGLIVLFAVGLVILYRVAPDRDQPQWTWLLPGAVLATIIWVVASLGFSFYASSFGSYNATYGTLGAVVILLFWLFLTALSVLVGAEFNVEVEKRLTHGRTSVKSTRAD